MLLSRSRRRRRKRGKQKGSAREAARQDGSALGEIPPERRVPLIMSLASSGKIGRPIIGKLLGHATQATTARYAHLGLAK
jgi:hypothetical protein